MLILHYSEIQKYESHEHLKLNSWIVLSGKLFVASDKTTNISCDNFELKTVNDIHHVSNLYSGGCNREPSFCAQLIFVR